MAMRGLPAPYVEFAVEPDEENYKQCRGALRRWGTREGYEGKPITAAGLEQAKLRRPAIASFAERTVPSQVVIAVVADANYRIGERTIVSAFPNSST